MVNRAPSQNLQTTNNYKQVFKDKLAVAALHWQSFRVSWARLCARYAASLLSACSMLAVLSSLAYLAYSPTQTTDYDTNVSYRQQTQPSTINGFGDSSASSISSRYNFLFPDRENQNPIIFIVKRKSLFDNSENIIQASFVTETLRFIQFIDDDDYATVCARQFVTLKNSNNNNNVNPGTSAVPYYISDSNTSILNPCKILSSFSPFSEEVLTGIVDAYTLGDTSLADSLLHDALGQQLQYAPYLFGNFQIQNADSSDSGNNNNNTSNSSNNDVPTPIYFSDSFIFMTYADSLSKPVYDWTLRTLDRCARTFNSSLIDVYYYDFVHTSNNPGILSSDFFFLFVPLTFIITLVSYTSTSSRATLRTNVFLVCTQYLLLCLSTFVLLAMPRAIFNIVADALLYVIMIEVLFLTVIQSIMTHKYLTLIYSIKRHVSSSSHTVNDHHNHASNANPFQIDDSNTVYHNDVDVERFRTTSTLRLPGDEEKRRDEKKSETEIKEEEKISNINSNSRDADATTLEHGSAIVIAQLFFSDFARDDLPSALASAATMCASMLGFVIASSTKLEFEMLLYTFCLFALSAPLFITSNLCLLALHFRMQLNTELSSSSSLSSTTTTTTSTWPLPPPSTLSGPQPVNTFSPTMIAIIDTEGVSTKKTVAAVNTVFSSIQKRVAHRNLLTCGMHMVVDLLYCGRFAPLAVIFLSIIIFCASMIIAYLFPPNMYAVNSISVDALIEIGYTHDSATATVMLIDGFSMLIRPQCSVVVDALNDTQEFADVCVQASMEDLPNVVYNGFKQLSYLDTHFWFPSFLAFIRSVHVNETVDVSGQLSSVSNKIGYAPKDVFYEWLDEYALSSPSQLQSLNDNVIMTININNDNSSSKKIVATKMSVTLNSDFADKFPFVWSWPVLLTESLSALSSSSSSSMYHGWGIYAFNYDISRQIYSFYASWSSIVVSKSLVALYLIVKSLLLPTRPPTLQYVGVVAVMFQSLVSTLFTRAFSSLYGHNINPLEAELTRQVMEAVNSAASVQILNEILHPSVPSHLVSSLSRPRRVVRSILLVGPAISTVMLTGVVCAASFFFSHRHAYNKLDVIVIVCECIISFFSSVLVLSSLFMLIQVRGTGRFTVADRGLYHDNANDILSVKDEAEIDNAYVHAAGQSGVRGQDAGDAIEMTVPSGHRSAHVRDARVTAAQELEPSSSSSSSSSDSLSPFHENGLAALDYEEWERQCNSVNDKARVTTEAITLRWQVNQTECRRARNEAFLL